MEYLSLDQLASEYGDADAFTNFVNFGYAFKLFIWNTVDTIIWSLVNLLFLLIFLLSLLFWPIIQYPIKAIRWFRSKNSDAAVPIPEMFNEYSSKLKKIWPTIITKLTQLPTSEKSSKFDFDLAEFHLHFSALAYQTNAVIHEVIQAWDGDLEYVRFGHEGCLVLVVFSVKHNFVEIAFKGTSPLNLSEWLTDCTMQKFQAKNSVLPGLVHAGFYGALGFPAHEIVEPILRPNRTMPLRGMTTRGVDFNEIAKDQIWDQVMMRNFRNLFDSRFQTQKPHLWITGHSLGAGTATVFTSMLLWRRTRLGSCSSVANLDWDSRVTIHGTYTFGNPRVGDTDWKTAIETVLNDQSFLYRPRDQPLFQFWRVINANDIVCTLPMASFGTRLCNKQLYGVAVNDFNYLGSPILLAYNESRFQHKERDPKDVRKNMLREFLGVPKELLAKGSFVSKCFALMNLPTLGMFGIFRDHSLSEYLKNLELAKEGESLLKYETIV